LPGSVFHPCSTRIVTRSNTSSLLVSTKQRLNSQGSRKIGVRCARCTGLALQTIFSAQLQRLPQALTICDTVPVSPGTPCAAEAAARGQFLRSCNTTYAFSSKSGLGRVVRFRLVVVTSKSALVVFTPADAVTTSDLVVNIARSHRRSNKPCCT